MLHLIENTLSGSAVRIYTPSCIDQDRTEITISDLSRGAQLTLWSIRRWVRNRSASGSEGPSIHAVFSQSGINNEAAEILSELLTLLSVIGIRRVRIQHISASHLTGDEVLILRVLRWLQVGQRKTGSLGISRLVRCDLANAFCRIGEAYAAVLAKHNLTFDMITNLSLVETSSNQG